MALLNFRTKSDNRCIYSASVSRYMSIFNSNLRFAIGEKTVNNSLKGNSPKKYSLRFKIYTLLAKFACPQKHLGAPKKAIKNVRACPDRFGVRKCRFWGEGRTGVLRENPPEARTRNKSKFNPPMEIITLFSPQSLEIMGFEDRQHWWVVCLCVWGGRGNKWSPPCLLSLTHPPPPPPCECANLMSPTANQQLNLPLLCKSWQYPRYVLSRHCRRSFLLHGPYPSMMVKIVTQHLHVILICPVRINSRQARIHRVMRSLREGSQHTLGNFFIPNKDFFQEFIEHDGTRFCGHRPLVWYLCCALQAFSFDWGFLRFEIHS